MKIIRAMNTTESVARQHGPCAPRGGIGDLGIPTKRPRQKQLKAARRKVHLTAGGTASPSMLFGKKKNLSKRKIKREQHKQLYDSWVQAQNWPALLGSHCRRRTMDGSLLAPRMNSSRESLPRKQEDGAQVSGGRWQPENAHSSRCILEAVMAPLVLAIQHLP